jgi:hypothetical protein
MTSTSVTLSIQIACPAAEAYRFIADPATMPQWAIHNVKAIRLVGPNAWEIQTPRGAGRLIPHYSQKSASSTTSSSIRKKDRGKSLRGLCRQGAKDSVYIITLVKPPSMPEEAFSQGMTLVEEELQTMRRILARQK